MLMIFSRFSLSSSHLVIYQHITRTYKVIEGEMVIIIMTFFLNSELPLIKRYYGRVRGASELEEPSY